jgi:sialate O-acetylesterase
MNTLRLFSIFIIVGIAATSGINANVSLPEIFSDHMVLQRDRANRIWGWADPKEAITIRIAGQHHEVVADEEGTWQTDLAPLRAGGPYVLDVRGENLLRIEDVLVGEVWFASGQSNMQFSVSSTARSVEAIGSSQNPDIRLFQVAKHSALEPVFNNPSKWEVCSPSTVSGFSAVAYFFGRELQKSLGVPVGLIDSSWGGTTAEEWTRHKELDSKPLFAAILDRWTQVSESTKELFSGNFQVEIWLDDLAFLPLDPNDQPLILDDFQDGNLITRLFGRWTPSAPGPWGHREVTVEKSPNPGLHFVSGSRPGWGNHLRVDYTPGRYIDLTRYAALQFRCRGTGYLKVHSLQPDINDSDNYSAGFIPLTSEWRTQTIPFKDLAQAGWGKRQSFTPKRLSGAIFEILPAETQPRPPSGLYNGMVAPFLPYGVRGALWYQGEGNAGRSYQYRDLLPALIGSWRSSWNDPELPFLVVQLPGYRDRRSEPTESGWAELREAQLLTALADDHVGLAVTIDLGEDDDVHPKEKEEVGRRLSLLARSDVYGQEIVSAGPLYRSSEREGNTIRLRFTHIGTGLVSAGGDPLRGFTVAGQDRRFVPADARIDGETVVVGSKQVPEPVAVRYAWADNPDFSLYNAEGLPASPFRTDRWPGVTFDKR